MDGVLELAAGLLRQAGAVWSSPQVAGTALALLTLLALVPAFKEGERWRAYRTRGFRTDALYTVFYVGGFYAFLIAGPVYRFLGGLVDAHAPFLRLGLLKGLPDAVHFVALWVVMDGLNYWAHRWLHASPLLWSVHSVHHSQEALSPLTNFRFHAADILFRTMVQFVPGLLLGTPSGVWTPTIWIQTSLEALSHADVDWGFGPVGRLLVSPRFHRVHHSAEPRHYNRNFGSGFSFWDDLFGTSDRGLARPAAYGVPELEVPESFLRQLAFPFLRIARAWAPRGGERQRAR